MTANTRRMLDFRPLASVIAILALVIGLLMLTAVVVDFSFGAPGEAHAILRAAGVCLAASAGFWFFGKKHRSTTINKREGYLVVALGWMAMVTFSMLPYLFSGVIPSLTDAVFETVSGLTTTGASVLTDIESVPKGILYWRSLTQWIGGMGIIVLTIAIFPLLGIGGVELFTAESPGPVSDKIHPRIRETAKRLWFIYLGLTGLLAVLLFAGGMSPFDAINHAFTTISTGGFSTRNNSVMAFDSPWIQYTLVVFMFLGGTNFSLLYLAYKRRFSKVWQNDEFRAYLLTILFLSAIVALTVFSLGKGAGIADFEKSFRDSLFQIVSLITTTGLISADYTAWSTGHTMLFFILLFLGASAGSTAGGIKFIRHLVFFKNSFLEFKRLLHPRAIIPLKLNGQVVAPRIMTHVIIFLLLFMMLFILGATLMSILGYDFMTSVGAVATCLGNVGPAIGDVGPVDNFAHLSIPAKWLLALMMLLGRLELFTILILFTPYFWKAN
jgi:trk system potassium uptake protein TrkH